MPCYKPILTEKIKQGEKVKFKKVRNVKEYTQTLNFNWKIQHMIACRKCIGCKLDNAREWAIRCQLETKESKNNYFISLTYATQYLHTNTQGIATCNNQDLTKFINSLRKHFERQGHKGIKYLASNEYGSKRKRPHYHICFFNLPLKDLKPTGEKNDIGQPYFISKTIDKIWNKGMHKIGITNYESAGYVARYTLKKQTKMEYKKLGIEPEKLRMSNGIGLEYFKNHKDEIYKYDHITIKTEKGVKNLLPPKYFDRKMNEKNSKLMQEIKEKRKKLALIKIKEKMNNTTKTYIETLGDAQRELHQNMKKLKRNLKQQN